MPDMSKDHVCVDCGAPFYVPDYNGCEHWRNSPGWCTTPTDHSRCPGHASDKPEGSCACSCHGPTDEAIEAATYGALKIQLELEGGEHAAV